MSENLNVSRIPPRRVLLVAANPAVATTTGWPVGYWASEVTHPWLEMTEAGYEVDIASPRGGRLELDGLSDPRHESGYSAHDVVSRGFLASPAHAALVESSLRLADCDLARYDAILIAGGQSPMFTLRGEASLQATIRSFHEAGKVVAALCHGVAALLDVRLSDGTPLLAGRTVTGFSNAEEDIVDALIGTKVMPFRIEDEARERGARYACAAPWRAFAVRDGRLVTGQQQYSGRATARLVIEALGV